MFPFQEKKKEKNIGKEERKKQQPNLVFLSLEILNCNKLF